jgi:3-methyladenine DNA glycosylase Tag
MQSFDQIYNKAAKRKGGKDKLESLLPKALSASVLAATEDSRYLAHMTKTVFQAGFSWRVVEQKWQQFETVFDGFDPNKMMRLTHGDVNQLVQDKRIIRNRIKIETIPRNARFVLEISEQHQSFGTFLANWPSEDLVGLWHFLKKFGCRLGGRTSQYFLRFAGVDTFVLSSDVVTHLVEEEIIDKWSTSKRDLAAVQNAFNIWRQESGRSLCEISKIIACSIGSPAVDY